MPRTTTTTTALIEPNLDQTQINRAAVAMVVDNAEAQRLAQKFSYHGEVSVPALETQLQRETANFGAASLAIGATLLMLRALCPHGEFLDLVVAQGYSRRTAQRLMSITLRFSKSANLALLTKAASSQSKLIELAFLDDEDLEVLAQGGEVSGITLDKIETLTASELRAKLRDTQAELQVSNEKRDKQRTRLDKLEVEARGYAKLPVDEKLEHLTSKALNVMRDAQGAIRGSLRAAVKAIQDHGHDSDENDRFLAGLIGELQHALTQVREEANLPDVSSAADLALRAEADQWFEKS